MVQKVTKETSMILAGGFPRRRDGGTHPLPTLGASGDRRSPQGWEDAGAWVEARWVYLIERKSAEGFHGCCVCTNRGIWGWSPSPRSASPAVLPAPPCCAPAWTKLNCLYLFVGSGDAGGGGVSKAMKKSFVVHAVRKMGAAAAGRTGQDPSVYVNKVFHPNTLACWQRGLCGKQRTKKLGVTTAMSV